MANSFKSMDGRIIRVKDYVEVSTRHGTKGKGIVVAIRENPAPLPDTMVLKMDEDTAYADNNRGFGWEHDRELIANFGWENDRERIANFGVFGGEIVRVIPKTLH